MSKLISKARSGVTLVELLVVILIVTILSVSLLPLLKPFVVEAQYAAEAIPVIGNLRTKVAMYQYEHGPLPSVCSAEDTTLHYGATIETWGFTEGAGDDGTATIQAGETDAFIPGSKVLVAGAPTTSDLAQGYAAGSAESKGNWGYLIDVDNQELVGKRCKPVHFQYCVISNNSTYCYAIGCFGDNHGLPAGTGYAVCEINVKADDGTVFKQIGTWKRYKAATDGQISFGTITGVSGNPEVDKKSSEFCPLPAATAFASPAVSNGKLSMVSWMETYGWEF